MKIQLANIILSILSFFLWKSIRYKHKKLIENGVIKKYGKKVMYAGFVTGIIFINSHNEYEEKKAIEEIRKMVDVIAETDVEDSCYSLIVALMEYALTYGSLIIYTALTIQKYLIKFKTKFFWQKIIFISFSIFNCILWNSFFYFETCNNML